MYIEVTEQSLTFKNDQEATVLIARQQYDKEKKVCVVYLDGEVVSEVASALYDELHALLSVGVGVILDMKKTTFLTPGFMEDLIRLEHKAESGNFDSMPIQNVSKALYDEIRKAGFTKSLDIEQQEDV